VRRTAGPTQNPDGTLSLPFAALFGGCLLRTLGQTGYEAGRYDMAYATTDFSPFGLEQVFAKPVRLSRIELLGPFNHGFASHFTEAFAPRTKKVDVKVEVSPDGTTWQTAGELRGLSAEADFLPVALPAADLKAIRLTGSAAAYSEHYPTAKLGIFGSGIAAWNPSFYWRLIAPAEPGAVGKGNKP